MLRWKHNWIIHLDGVFQTFDRMGDHHVHVARGMRRLAITDTLQEVKAGFLGKCLIDLLINHHIDCNKHASYMIDIWR